MSAKYSVEKRRIERDLSCKRAAPNPAPQAMAWGVGFVVTRLPVRNDSNTGLEHKRMSCTST
jgi:hypothetical protein